MNKRMGNPIVEPELQNAMHELLQLSQSAGWRQTAAYLTLLMESRPQRPWALFRCLDVPEDLGRCLGEATGQREFVDVSAAPGGLDMWLAERVIVAFPSGGIPTANLTRELAMGPHARPPVTVALLLTDAERIESDEDLDQIQSTARRWLQPSLASDSVTSEPLATEAFLWPQNAITNAAISMRAQDDLTRLSQWLANPLDPTTRQDLDRRRVLYAIELASSECQAEPSASSLVDGKAVYEARCKLIELRDQMFARLRMDGDALEAAIRVVIETLECDLYAGLPLFVENHAHELKAGRRAADLFDTYCHEVIQHWGDQPHSAATQWDRVLADLAGQARRCGAWDLVNQALARPEYPERLLVLLERSHVALHSPDTQRLDELPHASAHTILVATVAGALLGAGAGALVGLGAAVVLGGAGVGGAMGATIRRRVQQSELLHEFEASAGETIGRIVQTFRAKLTDFVDQRIQQLQNGLNDALSDAQTALDELCRSLSKNQSVDRPERDALARLYRQLLDSTAAPPPD